MVDPDKVLDAKDRYQEEYGFHEPENYVFKARKGLSAEVVRDMSRMKQEPQWMLDYRLKALEIFYKKPMPTWGADLSGIHFDDIFYYIKPSADSVKSWDEVSPEVKATFDKLGIPEAEQKFLSGVGAQYESEMVYHSIRKDLAAKGVLFLLHGRWAEAVSRAGQGIFRHHHCLDR